MNPCGEYGERFDSIGSSPCDSSKAEASPTGLFRQQLRIFGKARPRGNRPKIPLRVTGTRQPRSSEHPHAAAALPAAPSAVIPSGAGSLAPAALIRSRCRMPSRVPPGGKRGWIVPIGGAENKEKDRRILERFVRESGGGEADIVVIPTASRVHETGARYEELFRDIGAARVTVMDFDTRRDCREPGRLERIEEASCIFFTGGNQLRLTTLLGGTAVAKLIRSRNASGVTVGGTSAGASILCEHMIASGDEGSSMIAGSVRLAPGLGLTNRFIIDQHFRQRDRLGRLLTALAYNPFAIGIGLDEDTAAFIGPDETVEVEGSGGVTIVDGSEVSYSSIDTLEDGQPACMLGLRLHLLVAGATFNLHTRMATPGTLIQSRE